MRIELGKIRTSYLLTYESMNNSWPVFSLIDFVFGHDSVIRYHLKLFVDFYSFLCSLFPFQTFFMLYILIFFSSTYTFIVFLPSQLLYLIVNWKNVDREHFLFNRGVLQWHLCSLIYLVFFLSFPLLSIHIYTYVDVSFFPIILRIKIAHEHTRMHI